MSALTLSGTNLFAYCMNNPVSAVDKNGEWINVAVGALVGGMLGAISAASEGRTGGEIALSFVTGAISGGFAATGFGGVLGQMAVGAATSLVDSGVKNYNDYKAGTKTLGQAIVSTSVSTALGATFGAMGAEGTNALRTSTKITRSGIKGIKTLVRKGVHPTVKANARKAVRAFGRYTYRTFRSNVYSGVSTGFVGWAYSKYYDQWSKR